MVNVLLVASAAVLMIDSRLRSAMIAYLAFTAVALWLSYPGSANVAHLTMFGCIALVKLVLGPLAVVFIVRRYNVPENLAPSFAIAWRVVIAAAALIAAHAAARMPAFGGINFAETVFIALFSSVAVVILHRNLLAHVVGLLALGSAISLAGAVFAPGLPGAIELADTFDMVLATVMALAIARALIAYSPRLDVRSLRELRG